MPSFRARCLLVLAALAVVPAGAATLPAIDIDRLGWLPSDTYDTGEGLPDQTVTAIAVLPDGQAWVGTMRGLARQGGVRMVPEHGPGGALGGAIMDLAVAGDDLLVATETRGVWRRRAGAWSSLGMPFDAGRPQRLRVFGRGPSARIFATGGGVAEWTDERWRAMPLPESLADREQFDIALEPGADGHAGTVWIASYGPGLYRCVAGRDCVAVDIPGPGPRTDEIRSLQLQRLPGGGHALWVGMQGGGLARLAAGGWTRWHTANSDLPSDFVSDVALVRGTDGTDEAWVGTRSGLAVLRADGRWSSPDPRVALLRERVRTLAAGRNSQGTGVLWVGVDGGVVRMPLQGPWRMVSSLGKRGNGVWSVRVERVPGDGERLWLGSDGDGLARFEAGEWRLFTQADGLPSDTIRSVARVPSGGLEGELWVGTWGGHVARLAGERFIELPTPWPKPDNEAVSILLAGRDDTWISTRHHGLARWDGRAWHWTLPTPAEPTRAYAAIRDRDALWFSTANRGLARYRNGRWRYFQTDIGLPADDALYDMHLERSPDGRRVLWMGSNRHGLLRVDIRDPERPRLVQAPALPALPVSYVYGVVALAPGDMLACTDYGVFRLRREDGTYRSTAYHREDGLPHDECNANAMQVDEEGRAWIGMVGGAAVFSPPPAVPRKPAPLRLAGLLVDGEALPPVPGTIVLPRPDSTLELEYTLLTGEREDGTRYRVFHAGADGATPAWTTANSRRFARLPAGTQPIRIEAVDAYGVAASPIEIDLRVPQAWWRTPGARAIQVLLALFAFAGVLKLRERQLVRREEQLKGMVAERTTRLRQRESELRDANEELRRLSYTDPLTGLGNRRRLFESLDLHWRNAARRGEWLGLLLIDLDHFKRFNDTYGHLAGDAWLQRIGATLPGLLPEGASAARYGGEELCVLLPGYAPGDAARLAERLRASIAGLGSEALGAGGDAMAVTASIGVAACIPDADQRPDLLIARADRALYAAKAAGRDRVAADGD